MTMQRIRNMNEVLTGVFLILVALLAFYLASPLSGRTNEGLGPGYVPRMFASLQVGLGALLILSGLTKVGEASEKWQMRPLLLILAAIAFFAFSIERLGLVIALTGLVLIGCAANRDTTFRESIAVAIGSVAFSVLVFVKLLGLSIGLWP